MAELLADAMIMNRQPKLGIPEFIDNTPGGEMLGSQFGLLGKYCADQLEQRLSTDYPGSFSVVDQRKLQAALQRQSFCIADLGNQKALKDLSDKVGGMPILVQGTLRGRKGNEVYLQCKLVETDGDRTFASVGGVAAIDEIDWAMLGRSAVIEPDDRRVKLRDDGTPVRPVVAQVIARLDERVAGDAKPGQPPQGPNPLMDPSFPFRLKFKVREGGNGKLKERSLVSRGNDMFLPVRKGDVFEIWVENHSEQVAFMTLLVDGLNTRLEEDTAKGIATDVVAQPRRNINDARCWVLDPHSENTLKIHGIPTWAIRGFQTKSGAQGKLREFVVVDADKSLAARQRFTDQIGIITAAFFSEKGGTRSALGIGLGRERDEEFHRRDDVDRGNLFAVVHVRYADADELNTR
jgi:hypothetical protein